MSFRELESAHKTRNIWASCPSFPHCVVRADTVRKFISAMIKDMKEITGYPGYYAMSDGFIITTKYKEPRILKSRKRTRGYLYVNLCKNGKYKSIEIHRLMSMCFLDDYDESLQVNHIDGNKKNNNIRNLEMVTQSENMRHALRIGLKIPLMGEEHYESKLKVKDVIKMRERYKNGESIAEIAKDYEQVTESAVRHAINHITWKHI